MLKRVLFVGIGATQQERDLLLAGIQSISPLMESKGERIGKAFCMPDFNSFKAKYPFLCINQDSTEEEQVRAHSRFPSEIKDKKLYVGNLINTMSKDSIQLKLLGIKTIISLTPNKATGYEAQGFEHIHFEANESEHP
jgi:hypothetical protein